MYLKHSIDNDYPHMKYTLKAAHHLEVLGSLKIDMAHDPYLTQDKWDMVLPLHDIIHRLFQLVFKSLLLTFNEIQIIYMHNPQMGQVFKHLQCSNFI